MLNHLSDCIDRQQNLYRKLLDLLHEEQRAIMASDLEELNRVVVDKEMTLQHIRREEVERQKTAEALAATLGLDAGTLSITRLSELCTDRSCAASIKQKGARLQSLIGEIQIESERNRSLCLHALQFVGRSLKLLSGLTRPNQVYHASGRVQDSNPIGRVLSGAV